MIKFPKIVVFNTKNFDKEIFSTDYEKLNQPFMLIVCETDKVILFV